MRFWRDCIKKEVIWWSEWRKCIVRLRTGTGGCIVEDGMKEDDRCVV